MKNPGFKIVAEVLRLRLLVPRRAGNGRENWSDVYCIVIEDKRVANNFEQTAS